MSASRSNSVVVASLVVLLFAGCRASAGAKGAPPTPIDAAPAAPASSEDEAVIDAFFAAVKTTSGGGVFLMNKTYPADWKDGPSIVTKGEWFPELPGVRPDTRQRFVERNSTGNESIVRAPSGTTLVSRSDATALAGQDTKQPWKEFRKKHGKGAGIWTISQPAVSTDGSEAILFSMVACGMQCGFSEFIVFDKHNGEWRVSRRVQIFGL